MADSDCPGRIHNISKAVLHLNNVGNKLTRGGTDDHSVSSVRPIHENQSGWIQPVVLGLLVHEILYGKSNSDDMSGVVFSVIRPSPKQLEQVVRPGRKGCQTQQEHRSQFSIAFHSRVVTQIVPPIALTPLPHA